MNSKHPFNKRRILFLVTSFWASGELMIAREFAKNLKEAGHEVAFVLPPSHIKKLKSRLKAYGLIPKSRKLNQLLFHEIAYSFQPDLVILSDFLNYHFASKQYGIVREDLNIFKARIATFDNYNWSKKRLGMDTYGFYSSLPRQVRLEDYGHRIIPCPLENPDALDEDSLAYALCQGPIQRSDREKEKIYDHFQLDPNKKTIFLTTATWQERTVKEVRVQNFIKKANETYLELVNKLKKQTQVVLVGTEDKIFGEGKNLHYFSKLASEEFDDLISIANLYIGRNLISTSMVRMVLSGLPCLCLVNSLVKNNSLEDYAYPFRMFPVGWYDFLTPLLENNPYYDLVDMVEIFSGSKTLDHVVASLEQSREDYYHRLGQLTERLSRLRSPNEIIKQIIKEERTC